MAVLGWILQALVFLAAWKIAHLLYVNLRRLLRASSLALAVVAAAILAAGAVVIVHAPAGAWARDLLTAVLVGVAGGEFEFNRQSGGGGTAGNR
jgi:uncharacterized membrane protein YczE